VKGEYKVNLKGILRCDPSSMDYTFQHHYYLYRKTANVTEIGGNITLKVPFDDSFDVSSEFYCVKTRDGYILN